MSDFFKNRMGEGFNALPFQLPKIADAKPKFEIPDFLKPVGCVNCKNTVPKSDGEYCEAVKVCRDCLKVYSVIDAAIDEHADRKATAARTRFLGRF